MWSNDLAFIKDFLIVPIDREKLKALNIECDDNSVALSSSSISNDQPEDNAIANNIQEKDEYKNFLNKFDSLINESKIRLKHLEDNSK